MGKKSRAKAAHKLEREIYNAKLEAKKKEQKKTTTTVIVSACAVLLAVALIFGTVAAVTGSGVLLRGTVSLSTENFEVDNAMLSYFFYNTLYSFAQENPSIIEQRGPNAIYSLKEQNYTEKITWFDYIMDLTKNNIVSYLTMAEAAKANAIALDEADYADIDETLSSLDAAAKELGISKAKFISGRFGRGVKEDDIRRALEIVFLAVKQEEALTESIAFTAEDRVKYFEENKGKFTYISYKAFELSAADFSEGGEDIIPAYSARFGAVKTEESYDALVKEYTKEKYAAKGNELTEEDLNNVIASTLVKEESDYGEAFHEWAFDEARKAGDATIIKEKDRDVYTAYYLTESAHKNEDITKNIRQFLITTSGYENEAAAKAKAEELLSTWKAGEATIESFETLAKESNESTLPFSYENLTNSNSVEVAEFEKWVFDSERKSGDTTIAKTVYGYHVIYFVGDGLPSWEAEVDATMITEAKSAAITELEAKYPIAYDAKKAAKIPSKIPSL